MNKSIFWALIVGVLLLAGVGVYLFAASMMNSDDMGYSKDSAMMYGDDMMGDDYTDDMEMMEVDMTGLDTEAYQGEDFSINFPENWVVDESGTFGTKVMALNETPDVNAAGEQFTANLNVITEAPQGLSEEEYMELTLQNLDKLLTNYERTTYEKVGNGKYLLKGEFDQGQFRIANVQYAVYTPEMVYIVTGATTPEFWSAYESLLTNSAMTLTVN